MKNKDRIVLAATLTLAGCSALIGVNDLTYDPNAPAASSSGASGSSSGSDASSSGADGSSSGSDGATCSADLQKDPKHCGRCGHDCLDGECANGMCQPVELTQGQPALIGLAVDATHVYFSTHDASAVWRVPKNKGAVEKVASMDYATGIAIDGTTLYFGGDGGSAFLTRCEVSSCEATRKVLSAKGYIECIAVRNGIAYFTTETEVHRIKTDGTQEYVVGKVTGAQPIAVDDTHVYFGGIAANIQRSLLDGGMQEPVGPKGDFTTDAFIALDADRVFWASSVSGVGSVLAASKATPSNRTSFTTSGVRSIGIAVDDTYVYWSDAGNIVNNLPAFDGKLYACPKTGCTTQTPPKVLATDLKLGGPIVVDGGSIYWAEFGGYGSSAGRVRKVAKP